MCFKSSFEGSQGARITDGSRYIVLQVAGAETTNECLCKWRGGMRPVQGGSSARAQCPRRLMLMQLTRKVSRCRGIPVWMAKQFSANT